MLMAGDVATQLHSVGTKDFEKEWKKVNIALVVSTLLLGLWWNSFSSIFLGGTGLMKRRFWGFKKWWFRPPVKISSRSSLHRLSSLSDIILWCYEYLCWSYFTFYSIQKGLLSKEGCELNEKLVLLSIGTKLSEVRRWSTRCYLVK